MTYKKVKTISVLQDLASLLLRPQQLGIIRAGGIETMPETNITQRVAAAEHLLIDRLREEREDIFPDRRQIRELQSFIVGLSGR
jgi:hypothetical protein